MTALIDKIDLFLEEKETRKKGKKEKKDGEETREKKRNRKIKPTGDPGLEKDGGRRKRRTAYPSGRRELAFDMKRKKFLDHQSDFKKALGFTQKKVKSVLTNTGMRSLHRSRRY